MKTILLISFFVLLSVSNAQSLVSNSGNLDQSSDGSIYLSWAVGEIGVETWENPSLITEGFFQSEATWLTNINDELIQESRIKIYPNPAYGSFTIEAEVERKVRLYYQLVDSKGQVFQVDFFTLSPKIGLKKEISVQTLPSGLYWLYFFSDSKEQYSSFPIIINSN